MKPSFLPSSHSDHISYKQSGTILPEHPESFQALILRPHDTVTTLTLHRHNPAGTFITSNKESVTSSTIASANPATTPNPANIPNEAYLCIVLVNITQPHHQTTSTPVTMSHSHNSSMSSVEAERIYYNPRRENRDRKEARPPTKYPVVVHNYGTASVSDERRSHHHSGSKWK